MKITAIYGTDRPGSTAAIARMTAAAIDGAELTEFFLPRDFSGFCSGCGVCFFKDAALCPHRDALRPILDSLSGCDVMIWATPCYVMDMTGPLKAFLDHTGSMFMVHRPESAMFRKTAVMISTAAGGGAKDSVRSIDRVMLHWGVARRLFITMNVRSLGWDGVSDKNKAKALRLAKKAARTINSRPVPRVGMKTRALFYLIRFLMKRGGMNPADESYWRANGWLEKARPWRQ